jgi:hypothetical protein
VLVHVVNPAAPHVGARYFGHCEGMTVDEAIAAAGWSLPWNTILVRGQEKRTRKADWEQIAIGQHELVVLISQPLGGQGGASQILATVASIALALTAPGIGGAALGALGIGSGGTLLGVATTQWATVGALLGGSALISALLPHPSPMNNNQGSQSPTYSLTVQSNQARLLQVKPERFGRQRFLPDLASAPYADYVANQQNIYQEFDLGMGLFHIEEVGVANNPIWKRTEEHPEGAYTGTYPEIELQMLDPGEENTLFPNNVVTSPDVANVQMIGTNEDGWDWIGPVMMNNPGTKMSRFFFDVALPGGLFALDSKGKVISATAAFEVEAESVNDAGVGLGDRGNIIDQTLTMATRDAVRASFEASLDPARYRIWYRRKNAKSEDSNTVDALVALSARAFLPRAAVRARSSVIAMKARSTKNLNGSAAQQFYVIATRKLPLYDTETKTWSAPVATRSIAAAAAYACYSQNVLRKPDHRYDVNYLFGTLHPIWEERGDTFDGTFDDGGSALEGLRTILRAGRAQPLPIGGFIAFHRDQPVTVPRTGFNPLNMLAGSFNIDFQYFDTNALDAVWVDYIDERDWRPHSLFVALPDSTIAPENAPRMQWKGIVTRAQVWRETLFILAGNRKRRIFPAFATEMDGRVCLRGDKVPVTHWLANWGQAASVIALRRDAGGDILTLDQPWEQPEDSAVDDPRLVSLLTPDGRVYGPVTFDLLEDGQADGHMVIRLTQTATVTEGKYAGQQPRAWPQFNTNSESPPMEWPRASLGTASEQALDCRIVSMRPTGNRCEVLAVVEDESVHDVDAIEPPEETDPPQEPEAAALTITAILVSESPAEGGGTQINIAIVGAADAVAFDVSLSWAEAPDVIDLVGQPRSLTAAGQAGTLVVSARAEGESGFGDWFTVGEPLEATGVPSTFNPEDEDPIEGDLSEVVL